MKEFHKWWNRVSMEGNWDYEEYADLGWEAALEWILGRVEFANSDGSIIQDIKDELNAI